MQEVTKSYIYICILKPYTGKFRIFGQAAGPAGPLPGAGAGAGLGAEPAGPARLIWLLSEYKILKIQYTTLNILSLNFVSIFLDADFV